MKNHNNQPINLKPAHRELVKNHLLAGRSITQAEAIAMTQNPSMRLAPRILDLRKAGYPIETDKIHLQDGTYVASYVLPKWFLTLVDDNGIEKALWATAIANKVSGVA